MEIDLTTKDKIKIYTTFVGSTLCCVCKFSSECKGLEKGVLPPCFSCEEDQFVDISLLDKKLEEFNEKLNEKVQAISYNLGS